MLLSRKEIRIEWGDCDPGGIVYFPRYFEYSDACTHALFEEVVQIPLSQMRVDLFERDNVLRKQRNRPDQHSGGNEAQNPDGTHQWLD